MLRHLTALTVLCLSPFHILHTHKRTSTVLSLLVSLSKAAELTPGKLRSLGESALMERDYTAATSYYRQAIELEPDNAVNYYKLYNVHKRQRMLAEALDDIAQAVRVESEGGGKKISEYREQKAKLLVGLGRCEEAMEEYALLGDDIDGRRKEEAEKAANCARAVNMANVSLSKQDWNMATEKLKEILSYLSSPSDAPDLLFQLANALFHLEDYYGVISDTGKLLKAYPQHLEAYALRGQAYWKLNEVEMAGKHFREGLKLDPEHDGKFFTTVCLLMMAWLSENIIDCCHTCSYSLAFLQYRIMHFATTNNKDARQGIVK